MGTFRKKNENSSTSQSLVVSIQEEINVSLTILQTSDLRCIYRVPQLLRRVNPEAYTPVLVSVGPLHHEDEKLIPMNTHKLWYLQSFLTNSEKNADLKTYFDIIKGKEKEIRECYAEPINMRSDEFIRMVLIDSAFIVELFRTDVIVLPFTYRELKHDLLLAENQLPFFILRELYWAGFRPTADARTPTAYLTDLACEWLEVGKAGPVAVNPVTNQEEACCHLLDLLRFHYLPSQQHEEEDQHEDTADENSLYCPTAMSLYEAGVGFRVKDDKAAPCSLLDIHFDKGTLTIPRLQVTDSTESRMRNMIAFEQSHYPDHTCIANYHFFMDCLINTREDVQLLSKACIMDNLLGSNQEVAGLINSLCTSVYATSGRHASTVKQLNDHCDKQWNRNRAILKHTYFKHPWAVLSVIYAAILLLLTIVQVVTGILAM